MTVHFIVIITQQAYKQLLISSYIRSNLIFTIIKSESLKRIYVHALVLKTLGKVTFSSKFGNLLNESDLLVKSIIKLNPGDVLKYNEEYILSQKNQN